VIRPREHNFDGIVGPTHNYGGLSRGNLASMSHQGSVSNPQRAALEGLAKMRFVASLGAGQAVLPPHDRPSLGTLRRLGFRGTDEEILVSAQGQAPELVRMVSSAAPMWTANAATVVPSRDAKDGKVHLVPANLHALFHRAIEAETTERIFRAIFSDADKFVVHRPLPPAQPFGDEGAANHTRLEAPGRPAVHLFAWGRRAWGDAPKPVHVPARQTYEASVALARLHELDPSVCLFPQQHPKGIDAGAFHTDVLAVGTASVLLLHELAFEDGPALLRDLRALLGPSLTALLASESELPLEDAVRSYAFNSQLLELDDDSMLLLSPEESRENARAKAFFDRVLSGDNAIRRIEFFDLRQSMHNGGGPACLRLRVPLTENEARALRANVLLTSELDEALVAWVKRHYRDRLLPSDLGDPLLMREGMTALDELTRILGIGSVYDFQRA
jgi:succinylarginine dihydrolase